MPLPRKVAQLVKKFASDPEYYRSAAYKEMSLRSEFLNPVLQALGWDAMNDITGATADREVIQEDSVMVDGQSKAPDYAFLTDRRRRFFLEAKRPQINIQTDKLPAFQIRRYCWTAGLPLGIVTDFEEWSIYDCRAEPKLGDAASVGRLMHFKHTDLAGKWDYLNGLFGRDSVAAGSIDAFAASTKAPRGTLPIDQSFLGEIKEWRRLLAKDIARQNPQLSVVQLNAVVQTMIDRIIFLRIAEARGLEAEDELLKISRQQGIYQHLTGLFKRADDRYNSGLFHFSNIKGQRDEPDGLALSLKVGDQPLKYMVERLYYPYPYEFSVMPADILGRVYEQFLGDTIVLKGKSATVEEKPEVRKAGGVYYTPSPIVEYIVQETIGPLLDGATPSQVAKIKIVDPACGSGSFLIVAFQFLIDWHTSYYETKPTLSKRYLEIANGGVLRLATNERKRILLNNIFGVDIDSQAVEVTKLSLLLKVIEGQHQMEFNVGRILPDLNANVRCGNSLIGGDFAMPMLISDQESEKYNPFNWREEFPAVFHAGGFDAVVGNPPYLNIDNVWGKNDIRLAYIKNAYPAIYTDKTDILFYFLAKAVEISSGEIGFIVSRSFLEADKAQKLRSWLSSQTRVREVLDFRNASVFPAVGINTAIIRLTQSKAVRKTRFRRYTGSSLPSGYQASFLRSGSEVTTVNVPIKDLGADSWNFGDANSRSLIARIDASGTAVGDILHIGQGMQTGSNKAFQLTSDAAGLVPSVLNSGLAYRRARTRDIQAFDLVPDGPVVLYVEDVDRFNRLPENVQAWLKANRTELCDRAAFKRGNCDWWKYTWPLHKEYASVGKILSPYRSRTNQFAVDEDRKFLGLTDTTVLFDDGQPEDLKYIAAILNSDVLIFRHRFLGKLAGGGTYEFFENTVARLPIPRGCPGESVHDELVDLARQLEDSKAALRSTKVPSEKSMFDDAIDEALARLNEIVYGLFGLDAEDREQIVTALSE